MPWKIQFKPVAVRDLAKLPRPVRRRIIAGIESLRVNPRPPDATKLKGIGNLYRIRVGDYRVLYQIRKDVLLIIIARAGHRRDIYRQL